MLEGDWLVAVGAVLSGLGAVLSGWAALTFARGRYRKEEK